MPVIALYVLKLSIGLSAVWLFYQLLLRRLTFYNLNRWYLLFYSSLCFFIPLIDVGPVVESTGGGQPMVVRIIPVIAQDVVATPAAPTEDQGGMPDLWTLMLGVALLGTMIMTARLIVSWMALRRMRRKSQLIRYEGMTVYQVDAAIVPFSFGNAVFVNKDLHTERELEEVLAHEGVHIRQKHTMDIILAEFFVILNWYNPFTWLIRRAVRQNLEFIADSKVLEKGYDRKVYQYHLLKVTGQSPHRLANNFNFSSLKKRIVMMNRIQSARVHLVKFLFILPLMGVLLVSFRGGVRRLLRTDGVPVVNVAGIVTDDVTYQPLMGVTVQDNTSGLSTVTDTRGFFKLRIPAKKDSVWLYLYTHKDGYTTSKYGYVMRDLRQSRGLMRLEALHPVGDPRPGKALESPWGQSLPVDPGYADLQAELDFARNTITGMEGVKSTGQDSGRLPDPSIIEVGVNHDKLVIRSNMGARAGVPTLLYVIDGVPGKFDQEALTPRTVYTVDLLTSERSRALYGEKCDKCIAIEITTKQNRQRRAIEKEKWGPSDSNGHLLSGKDSVLMFWHK